MSRLLRTVSQSPEPPKQVRRGTWALRYLSGAWWTLPWPLSHCYLLCLPGKRIAGTFNDAKITVKNKGYCSDGSLITFRQTVISCLVQVQLYVDDASRDECGDDVEEDVRLTEMTQILENYQSLNIVSLMSTELYNGRPKTTLEYSHCCTSLQSKMLNKCRHFLYITGNVAV